MRIYSLFLLSLLSLSCGTKNIYEPKGGAKDSSTLNQATTALEKGNAGEAVSLLLAELPEKTQSIIANFSRDDKNFAANLKASLADFPNAKQYITLLGTAISQEAGVNTIDVAGKILGVQKSPTSLTLNDSSALARTISGAEKSSKSLPLATCVSNGLADYLAVVEDMHIDFRNPTIFLNKLWQAFFIWNAYADESDKDLFMLISVNRFVILITDIKTFDTNDDNKISAEEAAKMQVSDGRTIYDDLRSAISVLSVYSYLSNGMLDKTVEKLNKYLGEIGVGNNDSDAVIAEKVKAYLISITNCLL